MGRARGMDDQRLCIADIGEMREEFETLNKPTAGIAAALKLETQDGTRAAWQILGRKWMIAMGVEIGVIDLLDRVMAVSRSRSTLREDAMDRYGAHLLRKKKALHAIATQDSLTKFH